MSYKPLREILAALDAQQRREIAALSGKVDDAELSRVREAKKRLATVTALFIEQSWDILAPQLETFSLEAEAGKTTEELRDYLAGLRQRSPAFAWGWLRARMNSWLMRRIEVCVPNLLPQYPEQAALYAQSLRETGSYWFRETPLHHLKAGYHTALGAACKWYGSAFELLEDAPPSCPHSMPCFQEELRLLASFSMTMLARNDGFLWDSTDARPLDAVLDGGMFLMAERAIEELSLSNAPDYGLRLGCPALRARRAAGLPAFPGIIAWVEQIFCRYLLEGKEVGA